MAIDNMTVRYFYHVWRDDIGLDIEECDHHTFEQLVRDGAPIQYDRHSVFENGVRQICLTAENEV